MATTITNESRNALTKALEILDVMLSDSAPVTVLDIGRQLSLPRQTTHRLVDQLEQAGLVTRQLGNKNGFVVGPRLAALSVTSLRQLWRNGPVLSVIQNISASFGAISAVAVLDRDAIVFIHSACELSNPTDSMQSWLTRIKVERFPVHATAAGKLLAAHKSARIRKRLAYGVIHQSFTKSTITDGTALEAEYDIIQRRGYALACEEYTQGLSDIAVPVRDPNDHVVVALSVLATTDTKSAHDLECQRDTLHDHVAQLEKQLAL